MSLFLVLTHPVEPPTDSQFLRIDACIQHFVTQHDAGIARVFTVAGRKGYAIFVEVENHRQLLEFLYGNSMTFDEDYRVLPLASLDDEAEVLHQFNFI